MKLIIQIPCLNEEQTLPQTYRDLPKKIEGVESIEVLIVDDGSTDRTVKVAEELGVNHLVQFPTNRGLAAAFMAGIDGCLKNGADIIVNTDADNQYCGADIEKLIRPILDGKAEIVIGNRQTDTIEHFSTMKKRLQKLGSWIVRHLSNTDVPDTTSGFRAYSREAAMRLIVVSRFSYTLETIIQAGRKNISITHVPVRTNSKLRESRLFKSIPNYIKRSASTMMRIYTMYQPLKVFFYIGVALFLVGVLISMRFVVSYILEPTISRHIQSLVVSSAFVVVGFQVMVLGIVSDLIANNRILLEDIMVRLKKLEYNNVLPTLTGNKEDYDSTDLSKKGSK